MLAKNTWNKFAYANVINVLLKFIKIYASKREVKKYD